MTTNWVNHFMEMGGWGVGGMREIGGSLKEGSLHTMCPLLTLNT